MKAMTEIQPEVKRLQKEYKEDREEMQKRLMALYQERGVNPAAGCLPLILQMPIWFALFSVLRNPGDTIPAQSALADAVAQDETFFLSMDLLKAPSEAASSGIVNAIPYIILVLIVMAAGFYQQWQTTRRRASSGQPQPEQPQGMQTVLKIMPLFFGFISWGFPTGLVLYFATSNLFRIAQQSVILRMDDDAGAVADPKDEASEAPSQGSGGPGERRAVNSPAPRPPKSKPSPHASKKRKKRRRK
jgi:YidC/Oxa1 family membrane protein insertase